MIERHGELFIDRVYTPDEIQVLPEPEAGHTTFHRPLGRQRGHSQGAGHGLAARHPLRDIEVRNELGGKPVVAVRGGVKEVVEQLGIREIQVSISHCRTHATACANRRRQA